MKRHSELCSRLILLFGNHGYFDLITVADVKMKNVIECVVNSFYHPSTLENTFKYTSLGEQDFPDASSSVEPVIERLLVQWWLKAAVYINGTCKICRGCKAFRINYTNRVRPREIHFKIKAQNYKGSKNWKKGSIKAQNYEVIWDSSTPYAVCLRQFKSGLYLNRVIKLFRVERCH